MATASLFIFVCMQRLSHCFSCGQTRPHTAGSALVSFNTLAASANCPTSIHLIKEGMLMFTGQPSMQVGLAQSRQRCASSCDCSAVKPKFTSSLRTRLRYAASSSFIFTRGISVRSLFFLLLRNASLQGSARRAAVSSCAVIVIIQLFL
ncbi:hypothetical protein Barb4_05283 [Bacteroidales bacterium Barb4]|nr:hypothetical protein Barb4_05283 [Bacteroidales bacterium Barb4]